MALYVVGAWVLLQVAALAFDNWGIPTEAMRYVWIGAVVGLPIALVLGWRYDIADGRIVRTADRQDDPDRSLRRGDYLVLGVATVAALAITVGSIAGILQTGTEAPHGSDVEAINPQSIAVMPFEDMSPNRDQAHIADGIAEEVLHWLAAYPDLSVTSRTSAARVHAAGLSVPDIAAELRVAYVLEGSIRKSGNLLRVTAQLIEAGPDTHVWSEEYDFELGEIFTLYDRLSTRIAQELKATLRDVVPVASATDATTYELYLQGRRLLARRGEGIAQAVELFEQVVAQDPSFAPGFASLAQCRFWQPPFNQERLDRVRELAERALELDPANSEALAMLGRNFIDRGQSDEGRAYLERAIEANPNNALAYRWLGQSYQFTDPARYIALAQQAWQRDPLDPSIHWHRTMSLRIMGRMDEALAALRQRLRFYPEDELAYTQVSQIHFLSGDLDLAVKSLYAAYRARPDRNNYGLIVNVLDFLGEDRLEEAWAEEVRRRFGPDMSLVIQAVGREDQDRVSQLMTERIERGWSTVLGKAHFMTRAGLDLDRARPMFEEGFKLAGRNPRKYDPDIFWVHYIDFARILYHDGETDAADELVRDMRVHFEKQVSEGIKFNAYADHLRFLYAFLLIVMGETDEAVRQLEQAALRDNFICYPCFGGRGMDDIHDHPGFIAICEEQKARYEVLRQRLEEEGMLLTPEEALALDEFDFDPFTS